MSRSHSKIALALLLLLAITPIILSARPNPKAKAKGRKTRKADEEQKNVYNIQVTKMEIYFGDDYEKATAVNDGYPKLKITVEYPDLNGEMFQDNPTLTLFLVESRIDKTKDSNDTYSVKTDIDFEDLTESVVFTCSSISQGDDIDYSICQTEEQLTGYFTLFAITTDNGAYNYVYDNINIIDKDGNNVPQYLYWGSYTPDESKTEKVQDLIFNETDDNARYVIVSLTQKYTGDSYFFVKLESQEKLKRINCKSYGTTEIKCSGGGIPYGENGVLYYLTESESNFRLLNVTVKNEFYVLVKTNEFPEDSDTCSSIYKGYQFYIEFEGFTTEKVFDKEISVNLQTINDDETINYLPCLCWPTIMGDANNKQLTCETTKSGKGGKTYTLDPIIGFDCNLFNNGSFCLNIDNNVLTISTKIRAGYAGLDQARNSDLTYNKAQLSLSDYPRNITLYFRDVISDITEIVAGKVDITKRCSIQADQMSLKCMIYESDLAGNEQSATTYVSYEINFYDVCENFRRGPTIKVAGTTSTDDSNEDEEEKEHDYRNSSKGSSFLDVSRIIKAIILLALAF